jgi:putative ABC transport system substrate-binding protein
MGFVKSESVAIECSWADGRYEQLREMAADLLRRRISVLVAVGGEPSALAAKQATSTIPVVFGMGGDPSSPAW